MTKRSKLREYNIFLSEDGFCLSLSFLFGKKSHLFISIFEYSCLPKVVFFPDLTLIYLWIEVYKLFILLIIPVKSKNKTKNTSNNKSIILFLTFFYDWFQDFAAHFCTASIFYHHLKLKSILFDKDHGNKPI